MLTASEVAASLKISKSLVYELHASGALPGYRFGARTVRFDQADVDAYRISKAPKLIPVHVLREYERLRLRKAAPNLTFWPRLSNIEQATSG
jgi:excisionase family DNA binding protein